MVAGPIVPQTLTLPGHGAIQESQSGQFQEGDSNLHDVYSESCRLTSAAPCLCSVANQDDIC